MQKREGIKKMNFMEVNNAQLLEKLTELNNAPLPKIRNAPVIDGSMDALLELASDGLTIHENACRE